MGRPLKKRCCRRYKADRIYKPQGILMKNIDTTIISLDQFEAMRLCDLERMDQEKAGEKMQVSRGTIQRLLYDGRKQIMEAILRENAIIINLKESEARHVDMYTHKRKRWARGHRL